MSEWKEYKLGDCIEAIIDNRGKSAPTNEIGGFPLLEINSIGGYYPNYGVIRKYVNENTYRNWFRSGHPVNGDILIPTVGTIGIISIMDNTKACIAQNLIALRIKKDISNVFIYYFLKNPIIKRELLNLDIGGVQPSIKVPHLLNLSISLPPREVQTNIASILSSLDDKIDLLNHENATLEAMAGTLFRQWFIEETKEDGEEVALGDVVKTTSGGTPSRKHPDYYNNGTIYWVKSKELQGSFISSTEEMITEDAMNNSSAKLLLEKTVLIAMYGATVGEYGILSKPMTCNQAVCALIPNNNYPYTYLYLWTAFMKQEFINLATGAAQQNISQDLIKQQMVSGDIERIKKYHKHVCAFFDKMECNQKQIMILSKQRDILLPKLMSNSNII